MARTLYRTVSEMSMFESPRDLARRLEAALQEVAMRDMMDADCGGVPPPAPRPPQRLPRRLRRERGRELLLLQWDARSTSSDYSDEEYAGQKAMNCWFRRLASEKESSRLSSQCAGGFPSLDLDGCGSDTESETRSNISDEHCISSPRCKDRQDVGNGGTTNFLACCIRR